MNTNLKNLSVLELASLIYSKLKEYGLESVLVGGACVTIYSNDQYQSFDLDFVTYEDLDIIGKALKDLGFKKKNKFFTHPDCQYLIEFVSPPVAIGDEPVLTLSTIKTKQGELKMLTPTDCVKDRLASYFHWNDKQALEQALMVCRVKKDIDFENIKRWAEKERYGEKFLIFYQRFLQKK